MELDEKNFKKSGNIVELKEYIDLLIHDRDFFQEKYSEMIAKFEVLREIILERMER